MGNEKKQGTFPVEVTAALYQEADSKESLESALQTEEQPL